MKLFKTWNEFIESTEGFDAKIATAKNSDLGLISPGTQRAKVWVAFVHPKFVSEAFEYYKSHKLLNNSPLPASLLSQIRQDACKNISNPIDSNDRLLKLLSIVNAFYAKRQDILYSDRIIKIANQILNIFKSDCDAFVMLCHFIEKVFPEDFFTGNHYFKNFMQEIKAFVRFTGTLRPKIFNTLTLRGKSNANAEKNTAAFEATMEKLAEEWFGCLLCTALGEKDLIRVWDVILIHGFTFVHKFCLVLLSKNENYFRNTIKQEIKNTGLGLSTESLIVAGRVAANKLLKNLQKIQIEPLIKKSLTKSTYKALKITELIMNFDENNELKVRLSEIKELKSYFETIGLDFEKAETIIKRLEVYDNFELVLRSTFQNFAYKQFNWNLLTVSKFFIVFDQQGKDSLSCLSIKIGIALLIPEIQKKLELLYKSSELTESNLLDSINFSHLICKTEEMLYIRDKYYYKSIHEYLQSYSDVSDQSFVSLLKSDNFFIHMMKYLYDVDAVTIDQGNKKAQPAFFDGKSPISAISNSSYLDENMPEFNLSDDLPLVSNEIEVIGDTPLEISVLSNHTQGKTLQSPYKVSDFSIEDHQEPYEILKDPELLGHKISKSVNYPNMPNAYNKEYLIESQKDVNIIPTADKHIKRNSCSRLCSDQVCIVY